MKTTGLWDWVAAERWLAEKLGIDRRALFDSGTSTPETRAAQVRAAILAQGVADAHAGHRNGVAQTFAQIFESIYQVPLVPANSQHQEEIPHAESQR